MYGDSCTSKADLSHKIYPKTKKDKERKIEPKIEGVKWPIVIHFHLGFCNDELSFSKFQMIE